MHDGLGVVGVLNILSDAQDVSALPNVVLNVIVRALVRKLSHFNPKKQVNEELAIA